MSLPDRFLDDLRARIGLAALIGRQVKLVRAGREWKGCCPFHNEKTPSFYVNEDKGFYHCFGCGAHGDAIRFRMEKDGLSFLDAVKELAAEAGLPLPRSEEATPERTRRAGLRQLVAGAADWFRSELKGPAGAEARAYLARRQISPALQQEFGLGFAPDRSDSLARHLGQRFPDTDAAMWIEAGLVGEHEGRIYDRFRGRLLFPIADARGQPIGFGGRTLGSGEPKYLNSPDGPLFHKGHLLFNHHRAAAAARRSGRLLVVEGYIDVIALAGVGVAEAVAPLGTALTEEQILLLWKLCPEPVLAFDGDAAGSRAAIRAAIRALPLVRAGASLSFALLPAGQDPDDLSKSGGRAAIDSLISGAVPLNRFLFDAEAAAGPLDTPERRAAFRSRLTALAGELTDHDLRRDYLDTWLAGARALSGTGAGAGARPGPGPAAPGRRRTPWKTGAQGPLPLRAETRAAARQPLEIHMAMLLRLLVEHPALAERHREEVALLPLHSPALLRARDHLLAGSPPGELLAGYRTLSLAGESAGEVGRDVAIALAQCLSTPQMDASERRQTNPDSAQTLAEAFERNRVEARKLMERGGTTPAEPSERS